MVKLVPYGGNRDVEEGPNPKDCSFIHSLNKYVIGAHCVPEHCRNQGTQGVDRTDKVPDFMRLTS